MFPPLITYTTSGQSFSNIEVRDPNFRGAGKEKQRMRHGVLRILDYHQSSAR